MLRQARAVLALIQVLHYQALAAAVLRAAHSEGKVLLSGYGSVRFPLIT